MLLKISLGLAILVGLATLYVTHVQVGGRIENLSSNLAQTEADLQTSRQNESEARSDAKVLRGQLEETQRAYTQSTNELNTALAQAAEQRQRADNNAAQLREVTAQRNEAQQELTRWEVFGMTIDQIRDQLGTLRRVQQERDVFETENEALSRKVASLQSDLDRFLGTDRPVQLPPGTKGNVVAVDPKYDFVILDIGENQGVLERAQMLVNRDGKLIGKVQITQVEPNRSIANVLQDWKQEEIMEGDQVIF